jgi:hypothetical protein
MVPPYGDRVFAAVALLFTLQNFQMVSVDFLRLSARAPLALWIVIARWNAGRHDNVDGGRRRPARRAV